MTNANDVIKKIKRRGYWRVNIVPVAFQPDLIATPGLCKEMAQKSVVLLRGWDYPHMPRQNDQKQDLYLAGEKVESWIDWEMMKECWRFYQSGQFLHFFGIWDDWYDEAKELPIDDRWRSIAPNTQLDALETIYRLTEVFVFLRNLFGCGVYTSDVRVEVSLHGVRSRHLAISDPRRLPIGTGYVCREEKIVLPVKQLSAQSAGASFEKAAREMAEYLYHQFQWDTATQELFEAEQQRILTKQWF